MTQRAKNARYKVTPEGQAANRAARDRYWASRKGQQYRWTAMKDRLRARIAHKRARIDYLEGQLASEDPC